MKHTTLTPERMKVILAMQQKEITEYEIYSRIAERVKDEENRKILQKIAEEERRHASIWAEVRKNSQASDGQSSLSYVPFPNPGIHLCLKEDGDGRREGDRRLFAHPR